MSSLLQFNGSITKKGVGLQFIQTKKKIYHFGYGNKIYVDPVTMDPWTGETTGYPDKYLCPYCGSLHPYIWVAYRKPAGMFGCWVVFRYNGQEEVPDLSIPISLKPGEKLPKGAVKLSGIESSKIWHDFKPADQIKDYRMV